MTAFAEDLDGSDNTVSYSLIGDAGRLFEIDESTGEVFVSNPLPMPLLEDYYNGVINCEQYYDTTQKQVSIRVKVLMEAV